MTENGAGNAAKKADIDDAILKIALSRGMFFPNSEIFGENISGLWDYGPIGLKILNNIISEWRRIVDEIGGLEISGSVVLPRKVLRASGHEENFFDVAVICSNCRTAFRIDKLLEEKEPSKNFEGLGDKEYLRLVAEYKIKCERCGGELSTIRKFGTMFDVAVGLQDHQASPEARETNAYLRPEACQSIFLDFKRIFTIYGKQLPLTLTQVGKAFRNELSPRNNLLRQREFYQNDIEIFFLDEDKFELLEDARIRIHDKGNRDVESIAISEALKRGIIQNRVTAYGLSAVAKFMKDIGFDKDRVRYRKLYEDKAFYAKEAFDIEVKKGDEWVEICACNHRGDYDLASYERQGGDVVKVDDRLPNIFEISAGTDRIFYLLLHDTFKSDPERTWFSLKGRIAPFRAAVFPLLSKEDLEGGAEDIRSTSEYRSDVYYLSSGSIGKRYRKSDEIGVPLAFTVDYDTLEDGTLTVRDRETMLQFRAKKESVDAIIKDSESNDFEELKKRYAAH